MNSKPPFLENMPYWAYYLWLFMSGFLIGRVIYQVQQKFLG